MSKFNELYETIMNTDDILNEAGQAPGKLELVKTDLNKAKEFASSQFTKNNKTLEDQIPNFDKNYKFAQKQAGTGKTQRKDMPVIDDKDVKDFQNRLKQGNIDLSKPFSKYTGSNPFPEGLKGEMAKKWLNNGLKVNDGKHKDDVVKVNNVKVAVKDLHPIQKQIYFDKSLDAIASFGAEGTRDFLTNKSFFITSADNYIIDGHHRFLSGVLIDPNMKVNTVQIDLPIAKLLPMTLAYGDAVGNKRNA
jgi:hypothetical protein